jgi:hypothetical protein
MVKAGALYYAIFISFLVALLGGFLIMNVWMHHAHTQIILTGQRLERNVNSALLLAEEIPVLVPDNNSSTDVDLFNDGNDFVSITKATWGGYCLIKTEAEAKYCRKSAIALVGKDIFENEKIALYMVDKGQFLSVCGKTVIKGDSYLPKSGVRRAYIEGKSFSGTKIIDGKIQKSKEILPSLNSDMIGSNRQYLNGQESVSDSLIDMNFLLKSDTLKNSFYKKTLAFYSSKWVTLSNKVLNGNIRIISTKGVTITNSVQTTDIIVYAPKIEIERGFSGNLQLFASDTILVNDGVRLLFPSFLAIPETQNPKAYISIGKDCNVLGDVLLSFKGDTKNNKLQCILNASSAITGRVYCNGRFEIKGAANGTVYTSGFILRTLGSTYENHLLDAVINFDGLPEFYSGSLMNENIVRYKTMKWLY